MQREGFIFYQSFLKAGKNLPNEQRLMFFDRVLNYGIEGEDTKSWDFFVEALFDLIRPQLDANNKRFENGQKGAEFWKLWGRPRKDGKTTEESDENPENPKETPKEKDNVKEKDNDNGESNDIFSYYKKWLEKNIEDRNVTEHCLIAFYDLWYEPAKDETVESLRSWLTDISKMKVISPAKMIDAIHNWWTYWKWEKKKPTNLKASLLNNYMISWTKK